MQTKKEFWVLTIMTATIIILVGLLLWPITKENIKVFSVEPEKEISSPVLVEGEAIGTWFFEGDFLIKIIDDQENVLGISYAQAQGEWMTEELVPFKGIIDFKIGENTKGFLILSKDNPSNDPELDEEMRIPVNFRLPKVNKVKIYFNNSKLNLDNSCETVFAVEREVSKTAAVAKVAIGGLLSGLTEEEIKSGFFTNINEGVKIQSLTIKDGIAKVDFNSNLEKGVAGECRVLAIRAQIEQTLKQFRTVETVVISINNKTEGILQP